MAMSQKNYKAIAQIIRTEKREHPKDRPTLTCLQLGLSRYFKEDNPNFKPEMFYDACLP